MIRFCSTGKYKQQWNNKPDTILIMDESIWEKGHRYYEDYFKIKGEMVPVLNDNNQILCYAWQDDEANRQLRMLNELCECTGALDFKSLYSEIETVLIHGCNELAYCFRDYLVNIGVSVSVTGELWKYFGIDAEDEGLGTKTFVIHAEGIGTLESVSAEFECIDRIYEANIQKGIITDTPGGIEGNRIFERLKGNQIGILGTGAASLDVYDILLHNGIDIAFFVSEGAEQGNKVYGKEVINFWDARQNYKEVVFIDASAKYSAWGFGEVDFYDYLGYKRNQAFYLIRDYMEIPQNGLQNILSNLMKKSGGRLILTGDIWLCQKLRQTIRKIDQSKVFYIDLLDQFEKDEAEINRIYENEVCEKDICLLVLSEYYGNHDDSDKNNMVLSLKRQYLSKISKLHVLSAETYDMDNRFIKVSERECAVNTELEFKVKAIIVGASEGFSGNKFFRDLLDNHPDIMMLDWSSFNNNLFWFCIRLSMMKGTDLLDSFWRLCEEQRGYPDENFENDFPQKEIFNSNMKELLTVKEAYTSQELFVMFHIAYAKMWGREISNTRSMCIYWEPHHVPRDKCKDYALWLHTVGDGRYIVNLVRNSCVRAGSVLHFLDRIHVLSYAAWIFQELFCLPYDDESQYDGWQHLNIRFEDLKCKPIESLSGFCETVDIIWSDTLLETTVHGVVSSLWGVTGFDLKPVYNAYEEYLSIFDRFKIALINASRQKAYGYPYVENMEFSKRELLIFIRKEFRFEKKYMKKTENNKKIRDDIEKMILNCLQMNRRNEILGGEHIA